MTKLYITVDTEYSPGLALRAGGKGREENFARSIAGITPQGSFGIGWQMEQLERQCLKGVFFVDPMPALVWGTEAIADVVGPIVERGHDVQLHLHSEWLAIAGAANPLRGKTGSNLNDFNFDEQCQLLSLARSTLISAGAPAPCAFRAGNYGANDNTLLALAQLGIAYDTSHCPGISDGAGALSIGPRNSSALHHCGVIEVPIATIGAPGGRRRHFQLAAVSSGEILAALRHARDLGQPLLVLVSHSFEILSRDRLRVNRLVQRRFEQLCETLGSEEGIGTGTFTADPPSLDDQPVQPLPYNAWRTGWRMVEQALGNSLYGSA